VQGVNSTALFKTLFHKVRKNLAIEMNGCKGNGKRGNVSIKDVTQEIITKI
jgi:hypothetical protein